MIINSREELYSYVAKKTEAMRKMDADTFEVATMAVMEMASYLTEYEEEKIKLKNCQKEQRIIKKIVKKTAYMKLRDDTEKNFDTCFKVFEACLRKVES